MTNNFSLCIFVWLMTSSSCGRYACMYTRITYILIQVNLMYQLSRQPWKTTDWYQVRSDPARWFVSPNSQITLCKHLNNLIKHYTDVIMGTIVCQITSLTIVYSIDYSDADHRKHQSSTSLAFVWGIYRGPVNSPRKWSVTRKMFPLDDVIMIPTDLKSGNEYIKQVDAIELSAFTTVYS